MMNEKVKVRGQGQGRGGRARRRVDFGLRVVRIPVGADFGWLKLIAHDRWQLVKYCRANEDEGTTWRVEIVTKSERQYQQLKGLGFEEQIAKLLKCPVKDSRKLLSLMDAELAEAEVGEA